LTVQTLRRIFNKIDALFDRGAITHELHYSRGGKEPGRLLTARQAYMIIQPAAREFDTQARLKAIAAPQGAGVDGAGSHWEFFFDLPRRRAQLGCTWSLAWDEAADAWGPARIEINARPFPAEGGPIRQLVADGSLLHRQLYGLWEQERTRRADLPDTFRDTPAVMAELTRQGLDLAQDEFSLNTEPAAAGRTVWTARSRQKTWSTDFLK